MALVVKALSHSPSAKTMIWEFADWTLGSASCPAVSFLCCEKQREEEQTVAMI